VEGTIGDFLNIKPIISVNSQGVYFTYAKVRGRKASLQKLPEIIRELVGEKRVDLAVLHGGAVNEGQEILEKLKQTLPNLRKVIFSQISPVLGVHTGPGLVGVVFSEI
jgi:DegV family protein with EDD domain